VGARGGRGGGNEARASRAKARVEELVAERRAKEAVKVEEEEEAEDEEGEAEEEEGEDEEEEGEDEEEEGEEQEEKKEPLDLSELQDALRATLNVKECGGCRGTVFLRCVFDTRAYVDKVLCEPCVVRKHIWDKEERERGHIEHDTNRDIHEEKRIKDLCDAAGLPRREYNKRGDCAHKTAPCLANRCKHKRCCGGPERRAAEQAAARARAAALAQDSSSSSN
jgi:hypothetical protein